LTQNHSQSASCHIAIVVVHANRLKMKFILQIIALILLAILQFSCNQNNYDVIVEQVDGTMNKFKCKNVVISVYGCQSFRSMGATLKDPAMLVKYDKNIDLTVAT